MRYLPLHQDWGNYMDKRAIPMWNYSQIIRNSFISHIEPGERVEANDDYVDESPAHIKCPTGFANDPQCLLKQQRIQNRQETVNKRFKNWGILKQVFRGNIPDQGDAVHAAGVITQISIMGGERKLSCGYRNPPYKAEDKEGDGGEDEDEDLSYDTNDSTI